MFILVKCVFGFFLAAPGPPNNVRLVSTNSTSLTLSWEVPAQPNGNVTGYNYSCNTTSAAGTGSTTAIVTSVVFTGLTPFTTYTCSVSARTAPGEGERVTVTSTTNEDGEITSVSVLLHNSPSPFNFFYLSLSSLFFASIVL